MDGVRVSVPLDVQGNGVRFLTGFDPFDGFGAGDEHPVLSVAGVEFRTLGETDRAGQDGQEDLSDVNPLLQIPDGRKLKDGR